ncbi:MAG: P-II family nitrogen regulator [Dehalococcoidia bacterium]
MKKIEAIIRPEKLEPVREALAEMGVRGMTVSQVSGRGKQMGITLQWRAGEYRVEFLPKLKIECVVIDEEADRAVRAIANSARTGERGDGKIFVLPVEDALRISNGDQGQDAV